MPFGMGFVELALILAIVVVLVVVVFGATKLPGVGGVFSESIERSRRRPPRGEPPHLLLRRTSPRRWTLANWLLLGAALLSASAASALLAVRGR